MSDSALRETLNSINAQIEEYEKKLSVLEGKIPKDNSAQEAWEVANTSFEGDIGDSALKEFHNLGVDIDPYRELVGYEGKNPVYKNDMPNAHYVPPVVNTANNLHLYRKPPFGSPQHTYDAIMGPGFGSLSGNQESFTGHDSYIPQAQHDYEVATADKRYQSFLGGILAVSPVGRLKYLKYLPEVYRRVFNKDGTVKSRNQLSDKEIKALSTKDRIALGLNKNVEKVANVTNKTAKNVVNARKKMTDIKEHLIDRFVRKKPFMDEDSGLGIAYNTLFRGPSGERASNIPFNIFSKKPRSLFRRGVEVPTAVGGGGYAIGSWLDDDTKRWPNAKGDPNQWTNAQWLENQNFYNYTKWGMDETLQRIFGGGPYIDHKWNRHETEDFIDYGNLDEVRDTANELNLLKQDKTYVAQSDMMQNLLDKSRTESLTQEDMNFLDTLNMGKLHNKIDTTGNTSTFNFWHNKRKFDKQLADTINQVIINQNDPTGTGGKIYENSLEFDKIFGN